MLPSIKRTLFAAGAAAAVAVLGTAVASAATTFTVKAGTTTTGSTTYTAATTVGTSASPSIVFTDVTTGVQLQCVNGTAKGNIPHLGSGIGGPGIATITGTTWITCTGPLNLAFQVTQTGTWLLNAVSETGGVTTGNVSGVNATAADGAVCSFNVTGSADTKYTNSTRALSFAPVAGSGHTLAISGVSGCFGLLHSGDVASFTTPHPYIVTTPLGALSII